MATLVGTATREEVPLLEAHPRGQFLRLHSGRLAKSATSSRRLVGASTVTPASTATWQVRASSWTKCPRMHSPTHQRKFHRSSGIERHFTETTPPKGRAGSPRVGTSYGDACDLTVPKCQHDQRMVAYALNVDMSHDCCGRRG
mmetsp:Transcript_45737/g.126913  ORF Transcript_45737/g.126913 Transcript_45737/m.126913 type:complete len:143 (-) Transcript_45737:65-493(-)